MKLDVNIFKVAETPDWRVYSHPFAPGKVIVGRLGSIKRGESVEEIAKRYPNIYERGIKPFIDASAKCGHIKGTMIYKGRPMPKRAVCIAFVRKGKEFKG